MRRYVGGLILIVVVVTVAVAVLVVFGRGPARPAPSDIRIRLALLETVPAAFAGAPWYGSLDTDGRFLEIDAQNGVAIVWTRLNATEHETATMVCHALLAVAYNPHDRRPLNVEGVNVMGLPAERDASKPPREKIADCRP